MSKKNSISVLLGTLITSTSRELFKGKHPFLLVGFSGLSLMAIIKFVVEKDSTPLTFILLIGFLFLIIVRGRKIVEWFIKK